jgi:dihydroorotate dehydrogenase
MRGMDNSRIFPHIQNKKSASSRGERMVYEKFAKPLLFRLSAETAHHLVVGGMKVFGKTPGGAQLLRGMYGVAPAPELAVDLFGIHFPNPIGLAAGLDKNAAAARAFCSLGFGFIETGTITPRPQPGNDRPRLFRLPADEALINRMGFNNIGIEGMADNLRRAGAQPIPLAINIGKNKTTPNESAEEDYRACIRGLYSYGDFFVVNISSPNTPGLRNLQHGEELRRLLAAVTEEMEQQRREADSRHAATAPAKPVLVKIAPDLSEADLEDTIAALAANPGIAGVIATNTTIDRPSLSGPYAGETGGLSGKPLKTRATETIRRICRLTSGQLPIIGCGGVASAADAYEKIKAGASLIEVYTALIYQGPGINRKLNKGLSELLRKDGFTHISQAVGCEAQ